MTLRRNARVRARHAELFARARKFPREEVTALVFRTPAVEAIALEAQPHGISRRRHRRACVRPVRRSGQKNYGGRNEDVADMSKLIHELILLFSSASSTVFAVP